VITLIHSFLYSALIFDGLDTKTMQVIKIVQHDFDKIIFTAMYGDRKQTSHICNHQSVNSSALEYIVEHCAAAAAVARK